MRGAGAQEVPTGEPSGEGHLEAVLELNSCQLSFVACAIFHFMFWLSLFSRTTEFQVPNPPGLHIQYPGHLFEFESASAGLLSMELW